MSDCVFCPQNWENLDILYRGSGHAILAPLNPVVHGHVLVISSQHSVDATESPDIASDLMFYAALWAQRIKRRGDGANIITSIGPAATQTVFHTHVHVVPRRENDGLHLPWTGQAK